jgi:hypothetical protein
MSVVFAIVLIAYCRIKAKRAKGKALYSQRVPKDTKPEDLNPVVAIAMNNLNPTLNPFLPLPAPVGQHNSEVNQRLRMNAPLY